MALPKETSDSINKAAKAAYPINSETSTEGVIRQNLRQVGYCAGATEWAGKAEEQIEAALHKERNVMQAKMTGMEMWYLKRIQSLRDTLEQIIHAPVPANDREYMSWFVTAKNIAGGAISHDDAEVEVAGYNQKEVTNG